MNVYEYVADSNPRMAEQIMNSFNYDVINSPDMGLSQLVDKVGELALTKVMENHPDKEIILELFSKKEDKKEDNNGGSCGCDSCRNKNRHGNENEHLNYLNATGNGKVAPAPVLPTNDSTTNTHLLANQTNVILVVSALFIATALILKK
jgi:hypothetical protein